MGSYRGLRRRMVSVACLFAVGAGMAGARAVPDLKLKDMSGQVQKLSALRGKVVVLSFWATWCAPCQEELPRLSKLSEQYRGRPVEFVAVSIDEAKDRGKIGPLLESRGIRMEVWTGADVETMGRLGLGDIVPSTIILDERGEAVERITGEARDEDVRSGVDWLLGGRTGAAPMARVVRM